MKISYISPQTNVVDFIVRNCCLTTSSDGATLSFSDPTLDDSDSSDGWILFKFK